MMERNRSDRLRTLERTFTCIILGACAVSLYLSTVYSPVSSHLGGTKGRYVFLTDRRGPGKGLFDSIVRSHHSDIFRQHLGRLEKKELSNSRLNGSEKVTASKDYTGLWFKPLTSNPKKQFDYNSHPHFKQFLIINKDICKGKVDILIYIQSAVKNFQRRRVLRETWANVYTFRNITTKTVFLLGKNTDPMDQMRIHNENLAHGDIVQGNFLDSHKNLTIKAIMAARWITECCAHARYIIKADDDMFVNIFSFVEGFISEIWKLPRTIVCHLKRDGTAPIVRNPKSKWYVDTKVLPGKQFYPRFCPGYALMFTGDLAPVMFAASFNIPPIPVDDVYLFGMLLQNAQNLTFVNAMSNFTLNQNQALQEYEGGGLVTHNACSAWEGGAMERFWLSTLKRLTPWAQRHSSYSVIERRRLLLNITLA